MKRLFKNTKLMLGLAATLFIIGAFFITKGIVDANRLEPGWESLALSKVMNAEGVEIYPFNYEINLHYYFSTRDQEKREQMVQMESYFNEKIAEISNLLDADNLYLDDNNQYLVNLAYINQHSAETLTIAEPLYSMLKQAYHFTIESSGEYNIFAGNLRLFWEQQFLSDNPTSTDPQHDLVTQNQLNGIVQDLARQSSLLNIGLTFNDANNQLSIAYHQDNTNELMIDFQYLKYAFALDYLQQSFIEQNYRWGYFTSSYGHLALLGPNPEYTEQDWILNIAYPGDASESLARMTYSNVNQLQSVMISDSTRYSYSIRSDFSLDTPDRLRHPFYSSTTGYPSDSFRNFVAVSADENLVSLSYYALMAFLSPHEEAYNIMEENLFADCLSIAVYNRGNPIDNDDLQVLFTNGNNHQIQWSDHISLSDLSN